MSSSKTQGTRFSGFSAKSLVPNGICSVIRTPFFVLAQETIDWKQLFYRIRIGPSSTDLLGKTVLRVGGPSHDRRIRLQPPTASRTTALRWPRKARCLAHASRTAASRASLQPARFRCPPTAAPCRNAGTSGALDKRVLPTGTGPAEWRRRERLGLKLPNVSGHRHRAGGAASRPRPAPCRGIACLTNTARRAAIAPSTPGPGRPDCGGTQGLTHGIAKKRPVRYT